jgi:hypothetical protein
MADQKSYILTAIGSASKLFGVNADSVDIREIGGSVPVRTGRLTPKTWIQMAKHRTIRWTQAYVNYDETFIRDASFLLHWAPYADTGFLSTVGLSCAVDVCIVPQSANAAVGRDGNPSEAQTTLEAIVIGANPTWGTTAGTPAVDTTRYMLGPSTFNGAAISLLTKQTVDFGFKLDFHTGKSGSLFPLYPPIVLSWEPVITYETEDLSLVKDYINGPVVIAGASACKFQDVTGATGYGYTASACMAWGAIQGAVGTLRCALTDGGTFVGASY